MYWPCILWRWSSRYRLPPGSFHTARRYSTLKFVCIPTVELAFPQGYYDLVGIIFLFDKAGILCFNVATPKTIYVLPIDRRRDALWKDT